MSAEANSICLQNLGRKASVFKSICIQTQASSKSRPEKLGHFGKFEDRLNYNLLILSYLRICLHRLSIYGTILKRCFFGRVHIPGFLDDACERRKTRSNFCRALSSENDQKYLSSRFRLSLIPAVPKVSVGIRIGNRHRATQRSATDVARDTARAGSAPAAPTASSLTRRLLPSAASRSRPSRVRIASYSERRCDSLLRRDPSAACRVHLAKCTSIARAAVPPRTFRVTRARALPCIPSRARPFNHLSCLNARPAFVCAVVQAYAEGKRRHSY
jgi:hypothetical protein